ncbi:hypothetical protein Tco_0092655 [Tanacetum coccineum]
MDLENTQNNSLAKLPLLKQGEYDTWTLRIESYIQLQDYVLWEIIKEGNSFKPVVQTTANEDGTSTTTIPGPVHDEQKILKKNDFKARSILMMTLPSEHLLTFNKHKDAKSLFEAIKARFGGENITPEELNLKFLRSLPTEWGMHVVVWRNKSDLGSISFDDLYNNFKIVEPEVKRSVTSSSNSGSQNLAFVSGEATVYAYPCPLQPNGSQVVHEDLEQIYEDDLDEINLKWQLALLSIKARKFYQRIEMELDLNGATWKMRGFYQLCTYWLVSDSGPEIEGYGVKNHLNVQKPKQADQPRKVSQNPRNNSTSWNTPMPKKLGMIQKPVLNNVKKGTGQREVRPVWTNAMRVNHQNFSNSRRNFAPTAVLTKSGLVPFSTARQSFSRTTASVSAARSFNTAVPSVIYVNTVKGKKITSVVGKQGINAVKPTAYWAWRPKIKMINHVYKNTGSCISLATPGQTATGKESSNPFMAGSLPKTINANNVDKESHKIERQAPVMISDAEEYLISEDPVKQGRMEETENA